MGGTMRAAVFVEKGRIELREKPIPGVGPLDALLRVTTTTICGTDVHILKGEYPVAPGLTIGHEPVGVIEQLGSAVKGYCEGQRVIAGKRIPLEDVCNQPGHVCAAIHRGEDTDIVAGCNSPIWPADAVEARGQLEIRDRLHIHAK